MYQYNHLDKAGGGQLARHSIIEMGVGERILKDIWPHPKEKKKKKKMKKEKEKKKKTTTTKTKKKKKKMMKMKMKVMKMIQVIYPVAIPATIL